MDASTAWATLDGPWRLAFERAWEAFQAGSVAVGAVVVDASGVVLASGRNRTYEDEPARAALSGTYLAHAEVNALVGLPRGGHRDCVLLSTLEPCLLCTAATVHMALGQVRFAARDPIWAGIERIPELNPHAGAKAPGRSWADLGGLSLWAGALPRASRALRIVREGTSSIDEVFRSDATLAATTAAEPRVAALAHAIIDTGVHPGDGRVLHDVLERLWPAIEAGR